MDVLPLTILLSSLLAAFFLLLFLRDVRSRGKGGAAERAAMLPFRDDERPVPAVRPGTREAR